MGESREELLKALEEGDAERLRKALEAGADPNAATKDGGGGADDGGAVAGRAGGPKRGGM